MFRYCIMLEKIEVDGLEENVLDGVKVWDNLGLEKKYRR
jgi:hypothetical protein